VLVGDEEADDGHALGADVVRHLINVALVLDGDPVAVLLAQGLLVLDAVRRLLEARRARSRRLGGLVRSRGHGRVAGHEGGGAEGSGGGAHHGVHSSQRQARKIKVLC
jgi:hypothetical protein